MKKGLLIIGIAILVTSFVAAMMCLVVNIFNPFSEEDLYQSISIGCITTLIGAVCILTSEAIENEYIEEKEKEKNKTT